MSVGATDSVDAHAAFSTSNADVEISAPGVGIIRAVQRQRHELRALHRDLDEAVPHGALPRSGLAAHARHGEPGASVRSAAGLRAAISPRRPTTRVGAPG